MFTGLRNTRGNAGHELGLLAVALEVEQLGATIALEGTEEAAQLVVSVSRQYFLLRRHWLFSYRAGRHIRQLGAGEAGGSEGNQSGGELHLDDIAGLKNRYYERRAGNDSQLCIASADELRRARSGLGWVMPFL